jgi:hypothetical protein
MIGLDDTPTPLAALRRGLLAGVAGTAAMTAWQELSAKLTAADDQEPRQQPDDPWEQASAPAQVARRIIEGVFKREASPALIPVLTHATHWAYGTTWGGVYGLVAGSTARRRPLRRGLAFGTAVWAMSYVQLVPMGLYEPPWKYPPKDLAMDLSYHLVYGAAAGLAYRVLASE